MLIFSMIIGRGRNVVEPVWEFLRTEVATDSFICSYMAFMDEYSSQQVYCMNNNSSYDSDTMLFESYNLYTLVEFLRYVLLCYNKKNNMETVQLDTIVENTTIYAFDTFEDSVNFYKGNDNNALFRFKLTLDRKYMMPRPDYPYRQYWEDRSLKQLVMAPLHPNKVISNQSLIDLFENVWVENINITMMNQIHPDVVKKMFNNTKCRMLECSFMGCDDTYKLTELPFTNIHFASTDSEFTGAGIIKINYRRNSNKVDNSVMYVNL